MIQKHLNEIKELIKDFHCMGTYGMVELELTAIEKILKEQSQVNKNNICQNVSDCVFSVTEQQLEKLIEKMHANIEKITNPKGQHVIGSKIKNSTEATIKHFLKKHCC